VQFWEEGGSDVRLVASQIIERPPTEVFRFVAKLDDVGSNRSGYTRLELVIDTQAPGVNGQTDQWGAVIAKHHSRPLPVAI
jgi:hypothetical protein